MTTDNTAQQQRDELLHLLESSFRALAKADDVRTYRFDIGYAQGMLDAMDILRVADAGLFSADEMAELYERKRVVGNETVKRIEGEPTDDEQAGIDWWNSLDEAARLHWMHYAGDTGVVADAWAAFKHSTSI
ncbi:hypothetical protein AO946_26190 [Pseudomonas aeruginosa]|uniref:hypothetical protein n=1 Tax=Pseudomonas aeruginosa TaxID=287 RepID=UPI00071B1E83|nr:hypothetical protein [Pseudomonas aeruginosa]KSG21234.1 hypothetical protein AO946_26190 [Pseudomonas aeruginosa]